MLWFFGLHYLYLRRPGLWVLYFITCGGFFLWMLIDLFAMPSRVDDANGYEPSNAATKEPASPLDTAVVLGALALLIAAALRYHEPIARFLDANAPVSKSVAPASGPARTTAAAAEPSNPARVVTYDRATHQYREHDIRVGNLQSVGGGSWQWTGAAKPTGGTLLDQPAHH